MLRGVTEGPTTRVFATHAMLISAIVIFKCHWKNTKRKQLNLNTITVKRNMISDTDLLKCSYAQ